MYRFKYNKINNSTILRKNVWYLTKMGSIRLLHLNGFGTKKLLLFQL